MCRIVHIVKNVKTALIIGVNDSFLDFLCNLFSLPTLFNA